MSQTLHSEPNSNVPFTVRCTQLCQKTPMKINLFQCCPSLPLPFLGINRLLLLIPIVFYDSLKKMIPKILSLICMHVCIYIYACVLSPSLPSPKPWHIALSWKDHKNTINGTVNNDEALKVKN